MKNLSIPYFISQCKFIYIYDMRLPVSIYPPSRLFSVRGLSRWYLPMEPNSGTKPTITWFLMKLLARQPLLRLHLNNEWLQHFVCEIKYKYIKTRNFELISNYCSKELLFNFDNEIWQNALDLFLAYSSTTICNIMFETYFLRSSYTLLSTVYQTKVCKSFKGNHLTSGIRVGVN